MELSEFLLGLSDGQFIGSSKQLMRLLVEYDVWSHQKFNTFDVAISRSIYVVIRTLMRLFSTFVGVTVWNNYGVTRHFDGVINIVIYEVIKTFIGIIV